MFREESVVDMISAGSERHTTRLMAKVEFPAEEIDDLYFATPNHTSRHPNKTEVTTDQAAATSTLDCEIAEFNGSVSSFKVKNSTLCCGDSESGFDGR